MTTLILGNSHLAAIRNAARDIDGLWADDDEVDFFGIPGNGLAETELKGDELHPTSEGALHDFRFYNGIDDLPLSGYRRFVVVGGVNLTPIARLLATHRDAELQAISQTETQLVTPAFLREASEALLADMPARRIVETLRPLGRPILLVPEPMIADAPGAAREMRAATYDLRDEGLAAPVAALYHRALTQVYAPLCTALIAQPEATLATPVTTRAEFMQGSLRLAAHRDVPHDEMDIVHANSQFGAMQTPLIRAALARL